jgi:hypothetical protein
MRIDVVAVAAIALSLASTPCAHAGEIAYVNNPRAADGERRPAILWESLQAQRDCVDAATLRFQRFVASLANGERPDTLPTELGAPEACSSAQIADVVQGTPVEIIDGDDCGGLTRVRVVAGRSKDRVGCIAQERLSAKRVP